MSFEGNPLLARTRKSNEIIWEFLNEVLQMTDLLLAEVAQPGRAPERNPW
jgi:hypothetical protein